MCDDHVSVGSLLVAYLVGRGPDKQYEEGKAEHCVKQWPDWSANRQKQLVVQMLCGLGDHDDVRHRPQFDSFQGSSCLT